MSSTKPAILFVPGAWHSGFHAAPVLPYFQKQGYTVRVLTLANLGTCEGIDPKPTNQDSVTKVLTAMNSEITADHDVVLMGHSAGGLICAMGANAFLASSQYNEEQQARLKHILFLGSFINTSRHEISHWHHIDPTNNLSYATRANEIFYNDMYLSDATPFIENLEPMYLTPRPDEIEKTWHAVPRTSIVLLRDRAILPENQRLEAEEQGMRVVEMDSGHCPFISRPGEFVEVVDGILTKDEARERLNQIEY